MGFAPFECGLSGGAEGNIALTCKWSMFPYSLYALLATRNNLKRNISTCGIFLVLERRYDPPFLMHGCWERRGHGHLFRPRGMGRGGVFRLAYLIRGWGIATTCPGALAPKLLISSFPPSPLWLLRKTVQHLANVALIDVTVERTRGTAPP